VLGGDGPLPRKPDPAGLYSLMREADTSAGETMLVGDSPIDVRTARAAETRLCLARYGFGYEGVASNDIGAKDAVIDNPLELLTVLL
jgi:phosphoglycolate phosphatase